MKFKSKSKKGFTLVELVVVIAVIAVLAAVSVGAYFGITETANRSAGLQHIKQMNDMLTMSYLLDGQANETFLEARRDVQKQGLDPLVLKEFGGHKYGWDRKNDKFVIVNMKKDETTQKYMMLAPEEGPIENPRDIFIIAKTVSELSGEFSYYLHDDFTIPVSGELTINSGIDTGLVEGIKTINFVNTHNFEETFLISNNYYETIINVDAKSEGSIIHKGYSREVNVEEVAHNSYHEQGIVGKMSFKKGKLNIENDARVFVLRHFLNEGDIINNSSFKTIVNQDPGTLPCINGHDKKNSSLIADIKNVYRICEYCGLSTNYDGDKIEEPQPHKIGWIETFLDLEPHSQNCDHKEMHSQKESLPEDEIQISKERCIKCNLTYITTQASHKFFADNSSGETIYKCTCGGNDLMCGPSYIPKAEVSIMSQEEKIEKFLGEGNGVTLINLGLSSGIDMSSSKTVKDYDCGYKFSSVDTDDTIQTSKYKDWGADFVVYFDKDIEPESMALWGAYADMAFAIQCTDKIEGNFRLPLLYGVLGSLPYKFIATVVKDFYCGAINFDKSNSLNDENKDPVKIYVELVLYNEQNFNNHDELRGSDFFTLLNDKNFRENYPDCFITLNSFEHKFEGNPKQKY